MPKLPTSPENTFPEDIQGRRAVLTQLPLWLTISLWAVSIASIAVMWVTLLAVLYHLHHVLHPEKPPSEDVAFYLIAMPSFFGSVVATNLLFDLLIFRTSLGPTLFNRLPRPILPMKQVFQRHDESVARASLREVRTDQRKLAMYSIPVCIGLTLIGAIDPWAF